ncbi:nuclear transport factor 2 family protein [Rhodococcus fascians]|nr:nuclear transport factor 2 family protein [Rhodococcus fascians]MBY4433095.1 nuclear transport factor 2 family protein [Rhodococcus fascians]
MTHTNENSIHTTHLKEWIDAYIHAWTTNDSDDIARLFSATAEYHETPYETAWIGRESIVAGWRSRWEWQSGGWTFEWTIVSASPGHAVVTGVGHYRELGDFDNVWTLEFDDDGLCRRFHMRNEQIA